MTIREFQFLYGTIKSTEQVKHEITAYCFNSSMVQLKVMPRNPQINKFFVSIPLWYN